MLIPQRYVMAAAILGVLWGALPASAGAHRDCTQFNALSVDALPQAVYLPPLVEDAASYSVTNPGHLSEAHIAALRDILDRARCIAQTLRLPFAALRFVVYARTDDRGAREHILNELRRRGVSGSQLDAVGRSVVDVVAAWHRARLVVEQLRAEVSRDLTEDSSLGSVDPAGMVQPSELNSEEPATAGRVYGAPTQSHPRSFLVVIEVREIPSAGLLSSAPTGIPSGTTPSSAALTLPPIISISCCDICPGIHRPGQGESTTLATGTSRTWLSPPQLDVLLGAAIAVQSYTRAYLYPELAWLGIGVRLPIRRLELGVRLGFTAGGGSVLFNDIQQAQLRLGVGAALQIGALLVQSKVARLALGVDVGWLYMFRRIERIDFPFQGVVDTKQVHAPQAGGWLRLDVPLPWLPRLALSAELSLGVVPFQTENETPANLTAKALGGITYALR